MSNSDCCSVKLLLDKSSPSLINTTHEFKGKIKIVVFKEINLQRLDVEVKGISEGYVSTGSESGVSEEHHFFTQSETVATNMALEKKTYFWDFSIEFSGDKRYFCCSWDSALPSSIQGYISCLPIRYSVDAVLAITTSTGEPFSSRERKPFLFDNSRFFGRLSVPRPIKNDSRDVLVEKKISNKAVEKGAPQAVEERPKKGLFKKLFVSSISQDLGSSTTKQVGFKVVAELDSQYLDYSQPIRSLKLKFVRLDFDVSGVIYLTSLKISLKENRLKTALGEKEETSKSFNLFKKSSICVIDLSKQSKSENDEFEYELPRSIFDPADAIELRPGGSLHTEMSLCTARCDHVILVEMTFKGNDSFYAKKTQAQIELPVLVVPRGVDVPGDRTIAPATKAEMIEAEEQKGEEDEDQLPAYTPS